MNHFNRISLSCVYLYKNRKNVMETVTLDRLFKNRGHCSWTSYKIRVQTKQTIWVSETRRYGQYRLYVEPFNTLGYWMDSDVRFKWKCLLYKKQTKIKRCPRFKHLFWLCSHFNSHTGFIIFICCCAYFPHFFYSFLLKGFFLHFFKRGCWC